MLKARLLHANRRAISIVSNQPYHKLQKKVAEIEKRTREMMQLVNVNVQDRHLKHMSNMRLRQKAENTKWCCCTLKVVPDTSFLHCPGPSLLISTYRHATDQH